MLLVYFQFGYREKKNTSHWDHLLILHECWFGRALVRFRAQRNTLKCCPADVLWAADIGLRCAWHSHLVVISIHWRCPCTEGECQVSSCHFARWWMWVQLELCICSRQLRGRHDLIKVNVALFVCVSLYVCTCVCERERERERERESARMWMWVDGKNDDESDLVIVNATGLEDEHQCCEIFYFMFNFFFSQHWHKVIPVGKSVN